MAAYGLYTHIQSNKRRSVVLLAGLFFLVYVLTYAGALIAEVITNPNAWDRAKSKVRRAVIGFMQNRIERRLAGIHA